MRFVRATLLAAGAIAIVLSRPAVAAGGAEPSHVECGEGRAWMPSVEACVTLPVLKKKVEPDYQSVPGLHYGAILYINVSVRGTVGDVQILKAPTEGEPTEEGEGALAALVEAVRQWRFAPGLDPDGKPVAMTVILKAHLRTEE